MDQAERLDKLKSLFDLENEWEDGTVVILPNGEIQHPKEPLPDVGTRKPLTFRENLGGEYAEAA